MIRDHFVTLKCFVLEQISEGLDRAIMTMRKGEQALVTVRAEGHEVPGMVSANSLLHYEVELIDFTKVFCSQIYSVTFKSGVVTMLGNLIHPYSFLSAPNTIFGMIRLSFFFQNMD